MPITHELIWSVADALDQAGERPTQTAIRKKLGSGSFTTISEAMTEWHARRTLAKPPGREPVPDKVGEAATEFTALVWQVAQDLAAGRLQAERTALEEARQLMEAEKGEAMSFAEQLSQELEAAKAKAQELAGALEAGVTQAAALQGERDLQRARADQMEAISQERQKIVDTLKDELGQVRKDKDAEIARLVALQTFTRLGDA